MGLQTLEAVRSTLLSENMLKHTTGYVQTKWVCENLCAQAASRGTPITVYRPSTIIGSIGAGNGALAGSAGVSNTNDFVMRLVCGILALGKAPSTSKEVLFDLIPVDVCSAAVVEGVIKNSAIVSRTESAEHNTVTTQVTTHPTTHVQLQGNTEKVTSPKLNNYTAIVMSNWANPVSLREILTMLTTATPQSGSLGVQIETVPYTDWLACIAQSPPQQANVLYPLLGVLSNGLSGTVPPLPCAASDRFLHSHGLHITKVTPQLLVSCMRYFESVGFLVLPK